MVISAARSAIVAVMGIGKSRAWLRLVGAQHVGQIPGASAAFRYGTVPTGTFLPESAEPLGQFVLRRVT